jgi:hypothetical protein
MKIRTILESFFADTTREFVKDSGYEDSILSDGNIRVYHGSSKKNISLIKKSGKFKGFPFFALDKKVAYRFAQQAGGLPEVMELVVDADAILPTGGYLSARVKGLHSVDGVFYINEYK